MKRRMDRWSHVNNENPDHSRNDGILDFNKIDAKRKPNQHSRPSRWALNNNSRMHRNNFANSLDQQDLQSSSNDSLNFDWINQRGRSQNHNRESLDFNMIDHNQPGASLNSNRANERLNRSVGTSNDLNSSLFTNVDGLNESSSSDSFLDQELHLNSSDSSKSSSNTDEWQSALDDSVDWFNDITNSDASSDAFDDYKRILSEYNSKYGVESDSSSSIGTKSSTYANSADSTDLDSLTSSYQGSSATSSKLFNNIMDFTGLDSNGSSDSVKASASGSTSNNQSSSASSSSDRGNRHYSYINSYYDHHHPLIWAGIGVVILLILIIGGISFKHYKDHQEQVETYESSRETAINHRRPVKHAPTSSGTSTQSESNVSTILGEFYAKLNKAANSRATPAKISSEPVKSWKVLFLGGIQSSGYKSLKVWLNNLEQNNVTVKSIDYTVKSKSKMGKTIKVNAHSKVNYSLAKGSSRTEILNNQLTLKKIRGRYYIIDFNKGPMLSNNTVK